MSAQTIGLLSGGLVFVSMVPYAIRTYQTKIRPVPTTWSLWSLIGLALLLTYKSSGAEANLWPAVFGFVNPVVITILSAARRGQWKKPNTAEKLCLVLGVASLGMWIFLWQNPHLAPYALYLALVADFCAAVPTILFVWREPQADRPFAWVLFALGYLLAVFAIPKTTIGTIPANTAGAIPANMLANWLLPLYMGGIALAVAFPLILYRVRARSRSSSGPDELRSHVMI